MKRIDHHLERLFRSASHAPQSWPAEAPFLMETRVLAAWRSPAGAADDLFIMFWVRRALICAGLIVLASAAINYSCLRDAGPSVLAIADSALNRSLLP